MRGARRRPRGQIGHGRALGPTFRLVLTPSLSHDLSDRSSHSLHDQSDHAHSAWAVAAEASRERAVSSSGALHASCVIHLTLPCLSRRGASGRHLRRILTGRGRVGLAHLILRNRCADGGARAGVRRSARMGLVGRDGVSKITLREQGVFTVQGSSDRYILSALVTLGAPRHGGDDSADEAQGRFTLPSRATPTDRCHERSLDLNHRRQCDGRATVGPTQVGSPGPLGPAPRSTTTSSGGHRCWSGGGPDSPHVSFRSPPRAIRPCPRGRASVRA